MASQDLSVMPDAVLDHQVVALRTRHTVVKKIVDKCRNESIDKALEADAEAKSRKEDAGAP